MSKNKITILRYVVCVLFLSLLVLDLALFRSKLYSQYDFLTLNTMSIINLAAYLVLALSLLINNFAVTAIGFGLYVISASTSIAVITHIRGVNLKTINSLLYYIWGLGFLGESYPVDDIVMISLIIIPCVLAIVSVFFKKRAQIFGYISAAITFFGFFHFVSMFWVPGRNELYAAFKAVMSAKFIIITIKFFVQAVAFLLLGIVIQNTEKKVRQKNVTAGNINVSPDSHDLIEALSKLKELQDEGVISQEELAEKKSQLLGH